VASDGYIYKSGQCHPDVTCIFNSGTLALRTERQSALSARVPGCQKLKMVG